jgi:hypothetical protein
MWPPHHAEQAFNKRKIKSANNHSGSTHLPSSSLPFSQQKSRLRNFWAAFLPENGIAQLNLSA